MRRYGAELLSVEAAQICQVSLASGMSGEMTGGLLERVMGDSRHRSIQV